MTETPKRYACRICPRDDLSLTANNRVRSHAANGKRPGPDNPNCPGGSDWPKHDHDYRNAGTSGWVCSVCGELDPRPTAGEILATASGGPNPYRAPLPDHTHRYEYVAEGATRGHFECAVCQAPEELPPGWTGPSPLMNQRFREYLANRTPEQKLSMALSMDRTASAVLGLPLDPDLPHDRQTEPANWREAVGPARAYGTEQTEDPKPVTTETAAPADAFESAAPPVQRAEQQVERDGWGRYKLHHPETGKKQAWQRATTFARMLADTFGLGVYQQRMVAKGLSLRPDLLDMVATLEVKRDAEKLNQILEQAKDAAGQKVAANQGTVCHKHTEDVDRGDVSLDQVPVKYRADVTAYVAELRRAGITIVPNLIERITVVPDLGVGGTLDRIIRDRYGKYRTLDVKTGNMDFGQLEICIQLALYTHGVNTAGVYDLDTGTWEQSHAPQVETDYALVAHIPVGSGTCELLKVPIDTGWEAVRTAVEVRDWRKMKKLFTPYEPETEPEADGPTGVGGYVAPVAVRPPTWAERFEAVSSRGEAMSLYTEALGVLGQGPELDSLVRLGLAKLAGTEERAG